MRCPLGAADSLSPGVRIACVRRRSFAHIKRGPTAFSERTACHVHQSVEGALVIATAIRPKRSCLKSCVWLVIEAASSTTVGCSAERATLKPISSTVSLVGAEKCLQVQIERAEATSYRRNQHQVY